ncbi:uncharacterized protein LOC133830788 [Humulus lupulus]|uniref:uncharacterized protein LOC133830788 n=1 Tax=Humulus lupulus TaxID=3486 RepID=UPI002B411769|nr:uncharacterized protein LOC133830788 [Humulus lupulus]
MGSLYLNMFKGWCFTSNLMHHPNGRIVVAWNPLSFDVDIRGGSSQWMHFNVAVKNGAQFAITIVYAFNDMKGRERLWVDLEHIAHDISCPWIVMGDFNAILSPSDRFPYHGNGSELASFQNCVVKCSWLEKFNATEVVFFPEGEMDHSPFVVNFGSVPETRKLFKFFNFWSNLEGFQRIVAESWIKDVNGTPMFRLISKLKRLRVELKKLNRDGKGDVFVQEAKKLKMMLDVQGKLQTYPGNSQLIDEEISRRTDYQQAHKNKIQFLKQKVKEEWLKHGDENTKLFHNTILNRNIQNAIYSIWDMKGNWLDRQEDVPKGFS